MIAAIKTMKAKYPFVHTPGGWIPSIVGVIVVMAALLSVPVLTLAQPAGTNGIRLGEDVVPAPDGYETVTAKYVTAGPTDLYISPFLWAGKVFGVQLKAGQQVEVLAKPKGYDWLLVGKDGAGIGYVPISVLSQAR
jgi:hypothetical protein